MKLLSLLLIAVLVISLIGCNRGTLPETQSLDEELEVPENDLALPEETLSEELGASDEPAFSNVI